MSKLSNLTTKSLKLKITHTISHFFSTLCNKSHKTHFSFPSTNPPTPNKHPFKLTCHGYTWHDPYHWMSNINHPDFISYLSHENSYANSFMHDTLDIQRELFYEMDARIPAKISTPPEKWGPWLYYQYIPEGKEYPVSCRRPGNDDSTWLRTLFSRVKRGFRTEEILLDWNEIVEKYGYVHVGACRVSPDHNFLAYTLDKTGSEQFILQVKDLRHGHIIPSMEIDSVVSLAWAQDSSLLFYTVPDDNQRPYKVFCKEMTSNMETLVFTEDDSRFCVDITSTKDGKFITVNSNSRTSSEVYVIDATNPLETLTRVHKRVDGVQYFLEHHHGFFYVLTNYPNVATEKLGEGKFYLGICRVEDANCADWQSVILPGEGANFQDMDIFDKHLVLSLEKEGSSALCSINLPIDFNLKHVRDIEELNPWIFPVLSDSCRMVPGSNVDYSTSTYRMVLSSPVMPDLIVDYDMSSKRFSIIYQEEVLNASEDVCSEFPKLEADSKQLPSMMNNNHKNYPVMEGLHSWKEFSAKYACERHEVVSHDGIKVPLTLVFSRDIRHRKQSPGLIEAYGAYGEVLDKTWCSDRLCLLDRGWVVAFADVRGGGGGDPLWHENGSGVNKINSVYDLISCAKYLIDEGYVQNDRLAAIGGSAGSLLVGAAINFQPALFRAAILKVPFLDVCNTLMDVNLPLTILDHEEFGNPKIESHFKAIMEYSPYDNIRQGHCYPSLLVTAGYNDSRVGVWEAAKWVAKVRDQTCATCSRGVILETDMNGGHFGDGGSAEKAHEYAFLMKVMGLLESSESLR